MIALHHELEKSERVKHLLKHLCRHAKQLEIFEAIKNDVHEQFHRTKQVSLKSIDLNSIEEEFIVLEQKLSELLKWEQYVLDSQKEELARSQNLQRILVDMESRVKMLEDLTKQPTRHSIKQSSTDIDELKTRLRLLEQKHSVLKAQSGQKEDLAMLELKIRKLKQALLSTGAGTKLP